MNTTGTSLPLGVDLSSSVDGLYWGVIISTVMLGVTILQAWIYANDNKDRWPLRTCVTVLVLLDITTTALNSKFIHDYFIANFGNVEYLGRFNKLILAEFAVTIIIIFIVQLFFASRVYLRITKKYGLPSFIAVTACLGLAAGIYGIIAESDIQLIERLATKSARIGVGLDQLFVVICDLTITVSLSWNLFQAERHSHIKKTITMLQKLVSVIVARGILVTAATFVYAIMYIAHPTSLYWMPLHPMLSKLYVISMITMLNTRSWVWESSGAGTSSLMFTNSIINNNPGRGISGTAVASGNNQRSLELKAYPEPYNGADADEAKRVYLSRESVAVGVV